MSINYSGVELNLDDKSVFKVGNFLIQKKSDSTLVVFFIPEENDKIENIDKMSNYTFNNSLPAFFTAHPNLGAVGSGGGRGVSGYLSNDCVVVVGAGGGNPGDGKATVNGGGSL